MGQNLDQKSSINPSQKQLCLLKLISFPNFTVSFGGIAGLFLGFSLLSGVEIIYYFSIRACCMMVREKDELRRISKRNAQKPLPDHDLSLTPYFIAKPLPGYGINEVIKHFNHRKVNRTVQVCKISKNSFN